MPTRPMTVQDSIVIHVDPQVVYAAVSDPRRTSGWSPENTGARFDADTAALAVGDTFTGTNKRWVARWVTRCTITEAVPGEVFGFHVGEIGILTPRFKAPIASWQYRLRPVDGGTEVTETWHDLRRSWPDAAARAFDYVATRGSTFARFNARNIATTLDNLKRALEG